MHSNEVSCKFRLHTIRYVLVQISFGILPYPPRLLERLTSGDQINRWREEGGKKHMDHIISKAPSQKKQQARKSES